MDSPAPIETSAPAPVVSDPVPATVDAATKGDFSSFQAANRAARTERTSTPAVARTTEPPVAASAETPTAVAEPEKQTPEQARQVSKRQQQINDYERRIAEQDQRIRDLETRMTRPETPAKSPDVPAWKRYASLPNAPKLTDVDAQGEAVFGTMEEFTAAQSLFIAEQQRGDEARTQEQGQLTAAQQARAESLTKRLDAARAADPEFVTKLSPEVRALRPFDALMPGERATPATVVAEQVFDSPIVDKVLLHFSQQPEALTRLTTMPDHLRTLPHAAQGRAHTQWIVKEFGRLEGQLEASAGTPARAQSSASGSPISTAPPPSPSLPRVGASTDPKQAALERGDFSAAQRIFRAERLAKHGR